MYGLLDCKKKGDPAIAGTYEVGEWYHVKWANKRIREITLPSNTLIIAIKKKNGRTIIPRGGVLLEPGDNAVLWTCEFTQDIPEENKQEKQLPASQTENERQKKQLPAVPNGHADPQNEIPSEQSPPDNKKSAPDHGEAVPDAQENQQKNQKSE